MEKEVDVLSSPSPTPSLDTPTLVPMKFDVRIERLHKNIVDHKYKQYKTWLDKDEEIRLRKDNGEDVKSYKVTTKSPKATGVKSKPVVTSDSDSDDIMSEFQNRLKKIKAGATEKKEALKATVSSERKSLESKPNKSPSRSPLKEVTKPLPDDESDKKSSLTSPTVSKPVFESSSDEEGDKNDLVDMLFNMINDEDGKAGEAKGTAQPEHSPEDTEKISHNLGPTTDYSIPREEEAHKTAGQEPEPKTEIEVDLTKKKSDDVEEPSILPIFLSKELSQFVLILKMTLGFDCAAIELSKQSSVSDIDNLVERALSALDDCSPDYTDEDKDYLVEHGMRSLQVNVNNVRKDKEWNTNENGFVDNFKLTFGRKLQWKKILRKGLNVVKTSEHNATPATSPVMEDDNANSGNLGEKRTEDESTFDSLMSDNSEEKKELKEPTTGASDATSIEAPATLSEKKRDGSVSSDDTITISSKDSKSKRRSRKSSVSSEDSIKISTSKKSEPKRRSSLSSDDSVKLSKVSRDRSSSSEISVKDLVKGKPKKRTISGSSDDSIVITKKDSKRSEEKKHYHKDEKARKSSKEDSHHRKKKQKKDRDRDRSDEKKSHHHSSSFKIPKSDKKDKRDKEKKSVEHEKNKENHDTVVPNSTYSTPSKPDKKLNVEKLVEKSQASDPGLNSILSSMDKLSRSSSKKKHKEKKKKKGKDKEKDKDKSFSSRLDSDDDDLPAPVSADLDLDDLPAPVPADDVDMELPLPVPADTADTAATDSLPPTVLAANDEAELPPAPDDDYHDDLPDNNDDFDDIAPVTEVEAPIPDSACSSDEDMEYVKQFPKPVLGVKRRSLLGPPPRGQVVRPSLMKVPEDNRSHGRGSPGQDDDTLFNSSASGKKDGPQKFQSTFGEKRDQFDDWADDNRMDDDHDVGFVDKNSADKHNQISKPKPILKEKKDHPVGHFSRSKVSFNVSDSDVERTDSDRSRTPSPFLSSNKYYPWLYQDSAEKTDGDSDGIKLEDIKINEDEVPNDIEDDYQDSPRSSIGSELSSRRNSVEAGKSKDPEKDKKKGIGKLFERMISTLKNQNPSDATIAPPLPPQPVPPPGLPPQPRPVPPPSHPPMPPQPVPSPYYNPSKSGLFAPPPPPPPEESPGKIPLPPPTPRYESPEPGEITEAEETRLAKAKKKLLRTRWSAAEDKSEQPPPAVKEPPRSDYRYHREDSRYRDGGFDGRHEHNKRKTEGDHNQRKRFSADTRLQHEQNSFNQAFNYNQGYDQSYSNHQTYGDQSYSNAHGKQSYFNNKSHYGAQSYSNHQNYGHEDQTYDHYQHQGQDVDNENSWMDKYVIAWQELISNQEYYIRRDLSRVQADSGCGTSKNDLGTMYNEPRLNSKVKDPDSGETRDLYTCDTSGGSAQFLCTVCNVSASGIRGMQSHMNGRKHRDKLANFEVIGKNEIRNNSLRFKILFLEESSKSDEEALPSILGELIKQFQVAACLGLEYVVEVKINESEEVFKCVLCGTDSDLNNIMSHLLSTTHRLEFLGKHFPTVGSKFRGRVTSRDWHQATFDTLDTVAGRIEARYGRGQPSCVSGLIGWENERTSLTRKIEDGLHAR